MKIINSIMRVVFSIVLGGVLAVAANAANFTVNNNGDDDVCDGSVCTLRGAVTAANRVNDADTITIDATVTTITLINGQISISNPVTITPAATGSLVTIAVDANGRIFSVSAATTLNRLRLTNANVSGDGGAIINNGATLTINESYITNNVATNGGGIYTNGGTLNVNRSTIGGTSVNANRAGTGGGGIYNQNGTVNLTNSTVSGNTAGSLGGGYYGFASLGAATLNSTSNTIAFNAATNGGGIAVSSTLSFTSTVSINNTIVSNNTATNGADINGNPPLAVLPGTFVSGGYNIIRNTGGTTIVATTGDQFNVDPLILTLAFNGGLTPTHALQIAPVSPAIDRGNTAQTVDQRGFARPVDYLAGVNAGNNTDIGAFEVQLGSTAADATIGGRALTANGKAISRAFITITDSTGAGRTTMTNPSGYYRFLNVPSGATYIFNAHSKRYTFNPKVLSVTEENEEMNFVANP